MSTKPDQAGSANGGGGAACRRVTLISRRDCHLCEEMAAVVEAAAAAHPFELEVLDVDGDPDLIARYSERVPVLLIDGEEAFTYRVTRAELLGRLKGVTGDQ